MPDRDLQLLRKALNNPTAEFRDGQRESIRNLVEDKSRLLVVQRTGWGKSIVYFRLSCTYGDKLCLFK
jgi:ATP-dependent DNA helicase RecQ